MAKTKKANGALQAFPPKVYAFQAEDSTAPDDAACYPSIAALVRDQYSESDPRGYSDLVGVYELVGVGHLDQTITIDHTP